MGHVGTQHQITSSINSSGICLSRTAAVEGNQLSYFLATAVPFTATPILLFIDVRSSNEEVSVNIPTDQAVGELSSSDEFSYLGWDDLSQEVTHNNSDDMMLLLINAARLVSPPGKQRLYQDTREVSI